MQRRLKIPRHAKSWGGKRSGAAAQSLEGSEVPTPRKPTGESRAQRDQSAVELPGAPILPSQLRLSRPPEDAGVFATPLFEVSASEFPYGFYGGRYCALGAKVLVATLVTKY